MELLFFSVVLLGAAMAGAIDARVEKVVALPFRLHTHCKLKQKLRLTSICLTLKLLPVGSFLFLILPSSGLSSGGVLRVPEDGLQR